MPWTIRKRGSSSLIRLLKAENYLKGDFGLLPLIEIVIDRNLFSNYLINRVVQANTPALRFPHITNKKKEVGKKNQS